MKVYLNATIDRLAGELQRLYRLRKIPRLYRYSHEKGWSEKEIESEIERVERELKEAIEVKVNRSLKNIS